MPCFHPLQAWRTQQNKVVLTKQPPFPNAPELRLPCGHCLGCNLAHAKAWTLRCKLELTQHESAVFTTLTYEDGPRKPPTLTKQHLQQFLKRLREHRRKAAIAAGILTNRGLRFFASGEYGEQNGRPHYHAILYGPSTADAEIIQQKWPFGYTHTMATSIANIAYTAGYTNKKAEWRWQRLIRKQQVDPETGEVYDWQPPFIEMNTRPGIGAHAKKYTNSWRSFAVLNGHKMPVPRYYHNAWTQLATPEQIQQLHDERLKIILSRDNTVERLEAMEKIAIAQLAEKARSRPL